MHNVSAYLKLHIFKDISAHIVVILRLNDTLLTYSSRLLKKLNFEINLKELKQ